MMLTEFDRSNLNKAIGIINSTQARISTPLAEAVQYAIEMLTQIVSAETMHKSSVQARLKLAIGAIEGAMIKLEDPSNRCRAVDRGGHQCDCLAGHLILHSATVGSRTVQWDDQGRIEHDEPEIR